MYCNERSRTSKKIYDFINIILQMDCNKRSRTSEKIRHEVD